MLVSLIISNRFCSKTLSPDLESGKRFKCAFRQLFKYLKLELLTIDYLKNKNNFEINLIFPNNAYITLSTEIIEVTLDDQNKID